ncbi:unnamed protein product, partial [Polarella glacialis]
MRLRRPNQCRPESDDWTPSVVPAVQVAQFARRHFRGKERHQTRAREGLRPTRSMKSPTLLYDPQPRRASGGSSSSTATRRELPSVANSPEATAQVDASCAIGLSPLQRSNPPSTLRGDFGSASCSTSAGTYVAEENSIWSSAQSPELLDLRVAESEEQNLEVHHEEVPEDCRTAQPPRRPVARKGNLRPGLSRASSTQGRRDSVASDSTEAQNDLATQICAIQTIAELRGITLTFGDHPGCPTCASAGADIEYLQKQIVEKKERIVMCEEEKVPFDKAKEEASIAFLESAMKEISFRPCKEGQAKCRKARLEARHEMIDWGHTPDPQQPKRWAENARLPQLGTWMVWMVHRVFLNDPDLGVLDFACFALPAGNWITSWYEGKTQKHMNLCPGSEKGRRGNGSTLQAAESRGPDCAAGADHGSRPSSGPCLPGHRQQGLLCPSSRTSRSEKTWPMLDRRRRSQGGPGLESERLVADDVAEPGRAAPSRREQLPTVPVTAPPPGHGRRAVSGTESPHAWDDKTDEGQVEEPKQAKESHPHPARQAPLSPPGSEARKLRRAPGELQGAEALDWAAEAFARVNASPSTVLLKGFEGLSEAELAWPQPS